jgi:hypothetical protein
VAYFGKRPGLLIEKRKKRFARRFILDNKDYGYGIKFNLRMRKHEINSSIFRFFTQFLDD